MAWITKDFQQVNNFHKYSWRPMCGRVVGDNVGSQLRVVGSADLARLGKVTADLVTTHHSDNKLISIMN